MVVCASSCSVLHALHRALHDGRPVSTTHARAVVRPGRRWDVRTVARVCVLMSVGVPFVSYRRAMPARHRAALI